MGEPFDWDPKVIPPTPLPRPVDHETFEQYATKPPTSEEVAELKATLDARPGLGLETTDD